MYMYTCTRYMYMYKVHVHVPASDLLIDISKGTAGFGLCRHLALKARRFCPAHSTCFKPLRAERPSWHMRAALAFLALIVPSLSELLPPWYPTTRAPANYANQTWLDSLYPCSAAELAWIKLQTRSGAMSTDHAQHELGCRTAWRDSRNSCNWKQLNYIKHNVLTGKLSLHDAKLFSGCESEWVPPTQSPTPVPPTPFPTPVPPTPYPTLHPTPAPTPADYRCIPDFHVKKASAKYNLQARCCSEDKKYFPFFSNELANYVVARSCV